MEGCDEDILHDLVPFTRLVIGDSNCVCGSSLMFINVWTYRNFVSVSDVCSLTFLSHSCAVFYEGSWNRGYILSSSFHGCQVVLVDTEQVVLVDQDKLRVMRAPFARLPAQGLSNISFYKSTHSDDSSLWRIESKYYITIGNLVLATNICAILRSILCASRTC